MLCSSFAICHYRKSQSIGGQKTSLLSLITQYEFLLFYSFLLLYLKDTIHFKDISMYCTNCIFIQIKNEISSLEATRCRSCLQLDFTKS